MNAITKSTYLPISLVILACSVCFKIGASQTKNDSIIARVEALEVKSAKEASDDHTFEKETITRLSRIEEDLKYLLKGN